MASPLVGVRADPCPQCGSAEVYLRTDGAPQCKDCKWTGAPEYDSKYLQSWSTNILPPSRFLPAPERPRMDPAARRGGAILITAGVAHVASIFVVLYLLPVTLKLLGYHYLTWDTLLGLPLVTVGVIAQAVFALVAFLGAPVVLGGYEGGSAVFGTVGVVAILVSLLLFGGIVGAVGGALLAGAGAALRPSMRSRAGSYAPA